MGTRIQTDSVMCPRSSSKGRNTSASVTSYSYNRICCSLNSCVQFVIKDFHRCLNTGEIATVAAADGRIVSERAPATHKVLQTWPTVRPPRAVISRVITAECCDAVVPVTTATEWKTWHILDKCKTLLCRSTPRTLVAVSHARRSILSSVIPSIINTLVTTAHTRYPLWCMTIHSVVCNTINHQHTCHNRAHSLPSLMHDDPFCRLQYHQSSTQLLQPRTLVAVSDARRSILSSVIPSIINTLVTTAHTRYPLRCMTIHSVICNTINHQCTPHNRAHSLPSLCW